MPTFLSRRWRRQPAGPQRVRPYGIGAGIVAYPITSQLGSRSYVYDATGIQPTTVINGTTTEAPVMTPYGAAIQNHPINGLDRICYPAALMADTSEYTGVFCGYWSAGDTAFSRVLGRGDNSDSIRLELTSTTNLRHSYIDNSPAQFDLDLTIPTMAGSNAEFIRWAIVRRGTGRYTYSWLGRASSGPQTTGTATMRATGDAAKGVTFHGGGNATSHSRMVAGIWWKRGLSDGEVWAVLENPWLPLAPYRRRIQVNTAAAGGGLFVNPLTGIGGGAAMPIA
jgi:hypothetical protein